MPKRVPNPDSRKAINEPYILHNSAKVKPGEDYFTLSFYALLTVMFFILFFYRNIVGKGDIMFAGSTSETTRFSAD